MLRKNLLSPFLCLLIYLPYLSYGLSTPLEDPLSSQKFNIIYVSSLDETLDSLVQSHGNGTLLTLGDDMKCFIPNETKMSFLQQINNNVTIWNQLLEESLSKGLDIIDSTMHSKCLSQGNGFWKYQLCYGNDFLQYHNSISDTKLVNKLGSYLGISNSSEVTLIFDNEIGYYISEFLEPGDICDLTGKKREVEIQYVCGLNKDSPTLQWIKEVGTCIYEARVMVPGLCSLELFAKNEDKLSATQIVCQRSGKQNSGNVSHIYNIEGGIVNIVTDFDPTFLNNEIFLLNPVDINQQLIYLLYTGEMTDTNVMELALFNKFKNAFSTMIGGKLLKGPNNEIITLNDILEWWAPVINSDGELLFTVTLKMLSKGKAELYLTPKKNIHFPMKTVNVVNFSARNNNEINIADQDSQLQAKIEENMVIKEPESHVKIDDNKATLFLKNSKGEVVSIQRIQEAEDHYIFLFHILDENGEPISISNEATDELLMDLFENYGMESMLEQLEDPDMVNNNINDEKGKIEFISPQIEKQSNFHITNSGVYQQKSEDKDFIDVSKRNEKDVSFENIRSDEISEDVEDNYHNTNENIPPIEENVSEIAKDERQIKNNIKVVTSLEEEQVIDINKQRNIDKLETKVTTEGLGNQSVEFIETATKHDSVYDNQSDDIQEVQNISTASSCTEDTTDYQLDFTSILKEILDGERISDETSILTSSTSIKTAIVDSIEQHHSENQ